ncbi:hypothetical protein J3T26_23535 [Salmonella enterica]|uniref:hypothetical protein n=1 Tax=Salmonella enterica TaxID=28901 RepID=UPI0021D503A0|nr:hypothetical protein [Salmonella enterica]MCU7123647.1 hypothetical protein [Salmonella enterica]
MTTGNAFQVSQALPVDTLNPIKDTIGYRLAQVARGAFVYIRDREKTDNTQEHPVLWFCPQCYNRGITSVLQYAGINQTDHIYKCHTSGCSLEIRVYVEAIFGTRKINR